MMEADASRMHRRMDDDIPDGHSMDPSWFAVDAIGQVARFDTGENGHAPNSEQNDVTDELWALSRPADASAEDAWDLNPEDLCRSLNLYYFDYTEEFDPIGPYVRHVAPVAPLHIDQLPPDLRDRCREVTFDVRFDQTERIQPLEFVPCVYWY